MTETIRTKDFVIRHNIKLKMRQLGAYRRAVQGPLLRDALRLSLEYVGQVSAADFWVTTATGSGGRHPATAPTHPTKLTMRTGRLISSLVGAFRFSDVSLPRPLSRFISQQWNLPSLPGKKESIREVKVSPGGILAWIGTKVTSPKGFDYPAYHERGKRPFLKPAAEKALPKVEQIIEESLEGDFRKRNI